ncbi:MAG: hypothetical protein PQJ44_06540 [Sphaerochaetaceae bacterium]|nr:hypothetical protein [Sphaerochaetaceae bacterium]
MVSSKQKGNILEHRFIELISLGSDGNLTCFAPDSDDDGIDIIINRKMDFKPIFVQVKSRFNLNNGLFSQDIGTSTFRADEKFWVCFIYYNPVNFEIENIWFIPSIDFHEKSVEINPENHKQKLRFAASVKDNSKDKWSEYRVSKTELSVKVDTIIDSLYGE